MSDNTSKFSRNSNTLDLSERVGGSLMLKAEESRDTLLDESLASKSYATAEPYDPAYLGGVDQGTNFTCYR